MKTRVFPLLCVSFLLFFGFLRFTHLADKPLHHDEGVNSFFLKNLVTQNSYKYNPENYHGPTLYYFQLIPYWIVAFIKDGASNFHFTSLSAMTSATIRFPIALTGFLAVAGLLLCIPMIGPWGAFVAFLLAGLSPDLLFYSRYFIHEIYVVLFSFTIYLGASLFSSTRKIRYFYLAAVSSCLLFCTKETAMFTFIVLFLAFLMSELTHWFLNGRQTAFSFRKILQKLRSLEQEIGIHLPIAVMICLFLWVCLFSSFFTNRMGFRDSFKAFFFWSKQGMESGHNKRFMYYFSDILVRYETPLIVLSFIGIITAFIKNEKKGLLLSFWTLGIIGLYSIIPYKTPWLVINFILPMALVSGYGVQRILDHIQSDPALPNKRFGTATMAVGVAALCLLQIPDTLSLVYRDYDNPRHPQVYVHTSRNIYKLISEIDSAATRSGLGKKMTINIVSDIYWPLPFYLVNYPSAFFWGRIEGTNPLDAPIIIASERQKQELTTALKDPYVQKTFILRPGFNLILYLNKRFISVPDDSIKLLASIKSLYPPMPGLVKEQFTGAKFQGKPNTVVNSDTSFDFWWSTDQDKLYRSPFSIRWTGFIKIENAGTYNFFLESDDGSWLLMDGNELINNGENHGALKLQRQVFLSSGFHKIEIRYFDVGGGAVLKLTWMPPGKIESPIPKNLFFHSTEKK